MDNALMYLLGFLTEQMWLQALDSCEGIHSKERTKFWARKVYDYYPTLGWSEKTLKKLDLPMD